MTTAFRAIPRATISGGSILATYDRGGSLLGAGRVDEFVRLRFPALAAGVPKSVSMEKVGYAIRLAGVYLLGSANVTAVTLSVATPDNQDSVYTATPSDDYVDFPPIIIPSDSQLTIQIDGTATGLIIHANQIGIIETQSLQFE